MSPMLRIPFLLLFVLLLCYGAWKALETRCADLARHHTAVVCRE